MKMAGLIALYIKQENPNAIVLVGAHEDIFTREDMLMEQFYKCAEDVVGWSVMTGIPKGTMPTPQKQNQRKVRRDARRRSKR